MSKELREQINKVKNWKQFLKESSNDNKRLFKQMSDAPDEITIQITENGKNLMRKVFGEILKKSRPDNYPNNSDWLPPYTIDLVDKITLQKKYEPEISHGEKPNKIGSMKITQYRGTPWEKQWINLSPMFKMGNGKTSTDTFNMYALYIPFVENPEGYDTVEKAAMILINAGVDFNNSKQIGNFSPLDKGADYFDKFEVGQVSDKEYFKIIKID